MKDRPLGGHFFVDLAEFSPIDLSTPMFWQVSDRAAKSIEDYLTISV